MASANQDAQAQVQVGRDEEESSATAAAAGEEPQQLKCLAEQLVDQSISEALNEFNQQQQQQQSSGAPDVVTDVSSDLESSDDDEGEGEGYSSRRESSSDGSETLNELNQIGQLSRAQHRDYSISPGRLDGAGILADLNEMSSYADRMDLILNQRESSVALSSSSGGGGGNRFDRQPLRSPSPSEYLSASPDVVRWPTNKSSDDDEVD